MAAASADLAFVNGAVHTMDPATGGATAVAIKAGRIVAVGSDADIRELAGRRTEIVDLDGRVLVPGFQDAHVHPVLGGLRLLRCDLSATTTETQCLERVEAYVATHPGEWILGDGWSMDTFPHGSPSKVGLDRVSGNRPAYLPNRDSHSAWVNSAALRLAGIDARTSDPADGRIERDDTGAPTGALHDGAMRLVSELVPRPSQHELTEAMLAAQTYLHSLGITAWQDAMVIGGINAPDTLAVYRALAADGRLTARVAGALGWDRRRGLDQVEELIAIAESSSVGRFRTRTIKIMQDGVCETGTASMLAPYLDETGHAGASSGTSFVAPDTLCAAVTRFDAAGLQVHFHTIGDRAVREALDAVAAAGAANGPSGNRHHLAHIQVIDPADVPRFAEVGAVANAQPFWACHEPQMDELTIPRLGSERAAHQYPFAALLAAGARLAFGSDWPVTTPNPLQGMQVAVSRVLPGAEQEPFYAEQGIAVSQALAAATTGAAYVNHLDAECGTLTPGRWADLAVLDADPLAVAAGRIADIAVEQTWVAGACVHRRDGGVK